MKLGQTSYGRYGLRGLAGLKMPIYAYFFSVGDLTSKVGQTDLFLVCDESLLVGLYTQDYKSMCNGFDLCHPS